MFDFESIDHRIQKHIIGHLMQVKLARFRDMRPPKTDTNLYSYHLKNLMKQGYVVKTDEGYMLSAKGAVYVDRVSTSTVTLRPQPKIITMLVIQNDEGDVLVFQKKRQPFVGLQTLPYGKVHNSDLTIFGAAQREISEKLEGMSIDTLRHAGDMYVHVEDGDNVALSTLVHIFYGTSNDQLPSDVLYWAPPLTIIDEESAPGVVEAVQFALISKTHFFEEVVTPWR